MRCPKCNSSLFYVLDNFSVCDVCRLHLQTFDHEPIDKQSLEEYEFLEDFYGKGV